MIRSGEQGMRELRALLREVFSEFQRDNAVALGAALAYYTIFSLAPLLVLVIAVAGLALGRSTAQDEILTRVRQEVGPNVAQAIEGMILQLASPKSGLLATVTSLVTMVIGASGAFGQLQGALNTIWSAPPRYESGWKNLLRRRLSAFGMIFVIGFLLLVSMLLTALLNGVHRLIAESLPVFSLFLPYLEFTLSFALVTALFAAIFKILPDVRIEWRDVWPGAAVTALLFSVGKWLIGAYLGRAGVGSIYGAAGSLIVLLLWIYYSAQIFFLGAEFTEVYSRRYGSREGGARAGTTPVPSLPG
jgi:membrane protein